MLGDGRSALFLIWDATTPAPVLCVTAPEAEHGRGLTIVSALCAQWGFYRPAEPGGKVVWALLKPEPPDPSRFLSLDARVAAARSRGTSPRPPGKGTEVRK